jgi:hypothetical protein
MECVSEPTLGGVDEPKDETQVSKEPAGYRGTWRPSWSGKQPGLDPGRTVPAMEATC